MKAVADTLGVARSNPVERRARPPGTRGRYRKPGDALLLPLIRRLVDDERPSYGYRRITALLSRHRRAHGGPSVNAKRVLRIMQVNGLTLERHTARRPGRTHDGVVVALRPDVRWSSDHFEPACRNGEVVRVLLAIDACDREVIAWSAATGGVSEAFVRTLRRDHARLATLPDAEAVMALPAGLVRRLQRDPPPLRSALPLAPRVPPPECLTQPSHLSGQTGCTPPTAFFFTDAQPAHYISKLFIT
jgi:hypothetical protein